MSFSINNLKITDVVVYPVKQQNIEIGLIAFAKIVLNDQFIIHGIRVYQGKEGRFMAFPQDYNEKNNDGKPYSIAHPTTAEMRSYINDQVMAEVELVFSNEKSLENMISQKLDEVYKSGN